MGVSRFFGDGFDAGSRAGLTEAGLGVQVWSAEFVARFIDSARPLSAPPVHAGGPMFSEASG
jgi:hypothetical protein